MARRLEQPGIAPDAVSALAGELVRRGHCARGRRSGPRPALGLWRAGQARGWPQLHDAERAADQGADRARIVELVSDPLGRGVVMASALVMTLLALGGRGDDEERGAP